MHMGKNGMLYVTKHEYDKYPEEMKGNINSEYMEDGLVHSFLWNRTLIKDRALYIDGLTMVIEYSGLPDCGDNAGSPRL